MKQNIFGIVLFSVIVGTAVFVSESFVTLPTPPAVEEKPIVFESRNRCGKTSYQKGTAKVKLSQAVLNPKTGQLFTSLALEKENTSADYIGLTYHFYVKEGVKNQYLASETVAIRPVFDINNRANHEITSSYSWLDSLATKNNIYVIAVSGGNGFGKHNSIPRFDETLATPVLLMKDTK